MYLQLLKCSYTLYVVTYQTEMYKQWLNYGAPWLFIDLLPFWPYDASFPTMFLARVRLNSTLTSSTYPVMFHCLPLSSILHPIWFPQSHSFSPLSILSSSPYLKHISILNDPLQFLSIAQLVCCISMSWSPNPLFSLLSCSNIALSLILLPTLHHRSPRTEVSPD